MIRLRFICFALAVVYGWCAGARAEYSPSVGIPDPADDWGGGPDPVDYVTLSDPAEWSSNSEATGYYYIDNTESGATDSGRTYGRPGAARSTLPTTFTAGSHGVYVKIRGGPYSPSDYTALQWVGTSSAPIYISGDPSTRTMFTNKWRVRAARYLYIENIFWSGITSAALEFRPLVSDATQYCAYVSVRNCEATGTTALGSGGMFALSPDNGSSVTNHHVVYVDCIIHDAGDWTNTSSANDLHGFALGDMITDTWYIRCLAYHLQGDGFGNAHGANYTTTRIFWDTCEARDNKENPIDLKEIDGAVISKCHFHDQPDDPAPGGGSGEGVVVHYGPDTGQGSKNVFVFNSTVNDTVLAIISTESYDSYWCGNLLYDNTEGLIPDRGGGSVYFFGNTVARGTLGVSSTGSVDLIKGGCNIIYDMSGNSLEVTNSTTRSNTDIDHELIYNPGRAVSISWGSTYTSVADWIAGTTDGDNSIEADPLFVDAASNNFRLQAGSPARNAGYDWTAIVEARYEVVFSRSLTFADRNGVVLDTTPDIGALQYTAGADVTAPTISITSPTSSATYDAGTSATVSMGGTASDNVEVNTVTWVNSLGGSGAATYNSGAGTWTAVIPLSVGSNALTVTATDTSGNTATDQLTVTRSDPVPTPLPDITADTASFGDLIVTP